MERKVLIVLIALICTNCPPLTKLGQNEQNANATVTLDMRKKDILARNFTFIIETSRVSYCKDE